MSRRHLTDAELITALQAEAARLGRTPSIREVGRRESLAPVEKVYRQRFGSWRAAITRAGLTPRPKGEVLNPDVRRRPRSRYKQRMTRAAAYEITERNRRYWLGSAA